ncbi:hypothetical protein EJP02_531 [Escherichia phage EJP2]|nr:hypothetical protein EJP02_531 [Escherichia phage EJP2]
MNTNQVLNEIESIIKPMKRVDAMLTPEESRLYERYSVEQAQAMARIRPVASTDKEDPTLAIQKKIDILAANMYMIDASPGKVFAYDDTTESDFYYSLDVGDLPIESVIEHVVTVAYDHLVKNNVDSTIK